MKKCLVLLAVMGLVFSVGAIAGEKQTVMYIPGFSGSLSILDSPYIPDMRTFQINSQLTSMTDEAMKRNYDTYAIVTFSNLQFENANFDDFRIRVDQCTDNEVINTPQQCDLISGLLQIEVSILPKAHYPMITEWNDCRDARVMPIGNNEFRITREPRNCWLPNLTIPDKTWDMEYAWDNWYEMSDLSFSQALNENVYDNFIVLLVHVKGGGGVSADNGINVSFNQAHLNIH